jgi:hypothetical protein
MAASLLLFLCLSGAAKAQVDEACRSEWLPLHTGNYWIYRHDSRVATGSHFTIHVLGPYELDGAVWCQVESGPTHLFLRVDPQGRIFQRTLDATAEQLILDPANLNPTQLDSPLGFKTTAIEYTSPLALQYFISSFAKGIGRTSKTSILLSGSSGGFIDGETLIEAFVDGKLYRLPAIASPALQLDLDTAFRNCAVPCYYTACGIGSPVDPPTTFKPCLEARVGLPRLGPGAHLLLNIADSTGRALYSRDIPIYTSQPVLFHALPFYNQQSTGAPLTRFPSGDYFITASAFGADGTLLSTTSKRTQVP